MPNRAKLQTIRRLLETALDNKEEYLYQGEMSDYGRSYADDAIAELDSDSALLSQAPPKWNCVSPDTGKRSLAD